VSVNRRCSCFLRDINNQTSHLVTMLEALPFMLGKSMCTIEQQLSSNDLFFILFLLSPSLKFHTSPSKNQMFHVNLYLYQFWFLFFLLLFVLLLRSFWGWFFFYFIHQQLFHFIFISNFILVLLISVFFFVFNLFLDFWFNLKHFISFNFCIQFYPYFFIDNFFFVFNPSPWFLFHSIFISDPHFLDRYLFCFLILDD
jgi:hypothetical protein